MQQISSDSFSYYNKVLFTAVMSISFVLAVGAIFLPAFSVMLPAFLVFSFLVFLRPLIGLSLILLSVFMTNIVITVESPFRSAKETVHVTAIPIFIIYMISLPKILQNLRQSNRYEKAIMSLILFLLGWALVSFFWTSDTYHGVNSLVSFLISIFIVQSFLLLIKDRDDLYFLLNTTPIIGTILGIALVISKYYTDTTSVEIFKDVNLVVNFLTDHDRPGGFAPPDLAASVMNTFIFISISLMYRAGTIKRLMLTAVIMFLTFCNILTASKAGAGSLLIGLVVLIFSMPLFRKYIFRLILALISFIGFILALGGKVLVKRIELAMTKSATAGGFAERFEWWGIGLDRLSDTFGRGLGVGGFLKYIDPVPGAHSFYFSLLFDLGVIGFAIFIIIIFTIALYVRAVLQNCEDKEIIYLTYCFIANMIAFAAQAVVEGDFHQCFFWFLLALLLSVFKVAGGSGTLGNVGKTVLTRA